MALTVTALDHLVLNVADVQRSATWYQRVLGMEVKAFDPSQRARHLALGLLPGSRWQPD